MEIAISELSRQVRLLVKENSRVMKKLSKLKVNVHENPKEISLFYCFLYFWCIFRKILQ